MLWDLGGQIKMRGIWEKYYDSADAVVREYKCISSYMSYLSQQFSCVQIYVVDSSDIGRITESKQAFGKKNDNFCSR